MASGTQNLSSQVYKKQNKQITVNGVVENDFASHLLPSARITVIQILTEKNTKIFLTA